MNLNKVVLIGRLTADPELRTTPSGAHVTSFSIATNRNWADKDGNKREETEFHNIVAWGRQADVVNQFSKKGNLIMIEGRLQTRSWEGKDGQTRKTTEIVAERIQLGPRAAGTATRSAGSEDKTETDNKQEDMPVIDLDSDDIKPEDLPF
ncbi:MAG: single-stranded DNA-binding protein [Candidatus Colwellbacteria bacterium RIFCSPLOWO2_12_FULL_46_17]|uniref:Single-stranded DNA-binding protein n=2 Tax=Candidatus Colwelliibacteriota TaxID=1817904 RepID=A0A1G1ZE34_9BACT|nr:MAG: single-stranded DNA-binding protein [Candidatus Colwellbacteria bacterium RIFCSPLOWO2_02_FULL_45_11]OGY62689.1 MAG: single-stranded DNA-binding protein [Candidatus Colwellbacteria bacterium RIFCSPLOWO2_12_FULL_46_17]